MMDREYESDLVQAIGSAQEVINSQSTLIEELRRQLKQSEDKLRGFDQRTYKSSDPVWNKPDGADEALVKVWGGGGAAEYDSSAVSGVGGSSGSLCGHGSGHSNCDGSGKEEFEKQISDQGTLPAPASDPITDDDDAREFSRIDFTRIPDSELILTLYLGILDLDIALSKSLSSHQRNEQRRKFLKFLSKLKHVAELAMHRERGLLASRDNEYEWRKKFESGYQEHRAAFSALNSRLQSLVGDPNYSGLDDLMLLKEYKHLVSLAEDE